MFENWKKRWINKLCQIVHSSRTSKIMWCIFYKRYSELLKNHTNVKKVRHTSEFLSGIYRWTWKTIIKKTRSRPIKNVRIKHLEISSLYTCVPKTTITWGTVPETRSETDWISCHFGVFFPFTPPSIPTKNWKNQNFEKMKKISGDIILHMCTINENHMM